MKTSVADINAVWVVAGASATGVMGFWGAYDWERDSEKDGGDGTEFKIFSCKFR